MKFDSITTPQDRGTAFSPVFDTVVDDHTFIVALGEGKMVGGEVHVELSGADSLRRLAERAQLDSTATSVHFAELDSAQSVDSRMRSVFEVLDDGAAVMFLCRNAEVCDAAWELLNVRIRTGTVTRH